MSGRVKALPPVEVLRGLFEYRSDGALLWKVKVRGTSGVGSEAGGANLTHSSGCIYRKVSVPGFGRFLTHRVVWLLHNGEIPEGLWVDHIDRDKLNNRIENLRLVSWAENQRNTSAKNRTGLPKHVHKTSTGRYAAIIRVGTYDTPELASMAAVTAATLLHANS
jgi:hypothetical protein